ncbi:killer toxin subunits alpha/beta 2 [Colletotrichum tofieldiae]|nr:killer toxin subunits alpha/beta 2 [Colletotrichum tofieldiae]
MSAVTGGTLGGPLGTFPSLASLPLSLVVSVPGIANSPGCKFTRDRLTSYATPGRCTGTAEYFADAEIKEIIGGLGTWTREPSPFQALRYPGHNGNHRLGQ